MKIFTNSNGLKLLSILFIFNLLTACGGGGGRTSASADTTAPVITLIGDNPQTIIQGAAYIELGATAQDNVNGNISNNIRIDASAVDTDTAASYSVTYNVSDSAGNAAITQTRTVEVVAADTTPDAFSFIDQEDVAPNVLVTSNSITISGIEAAASISVAGGEYSIDGGNFTSVDGTLTNGQSVVVQQTSSPNSETTTDTVVVIGGVSDSFSVTTIRAISASFVEKVDAITFSKINLYEGNVNLNDRNLIELNVGDLNSGDLITVDVEFEVDGSISDYALAVQLVPQSLVLQFEKGTTLDEIIQGEISADEGEEIIDLGGVYVEKITTGILHGVVHTKLPALAKDTVYRVVVTPDISYLASGQKDTLADELKLIPVFFDERELSINKLDGVVVNIINPPKLLEKNDFTHLEIGGKFDGNGFSARPIFQTSVEVDITSFNQSENIVLSMSWLAPTGESFELALLSSDNLGNPTISNQASFQVARNGGTAISVPVVTYISKDVHERMIKFATSIKDIAGEYPQSGEFILNISYIENGVSVETPVSYTFNLPLVSQDLRAIVINNTDIVPFTVLRAGSTNSACLAISPDIDTGLINIDSTSAITASTCVAERDEMLWRYDISTKQIVAKIQDRNEDSYCVTVFGTNILPNTYQLNKCEFKSSAPEIAIDSQRFEFDDDKIRLELFPAYLDVTFSTSLIKPVRLTYPPDIASNFFRDSNGLDLDSNGRLFFVGDSVTASFGDSSTAQVTLSYGGESYVDYMPVIGITTEGQVSLSVDLFGNTADLAAASFAYKRYLSKQISVVAGNLRPVEVGNGAEATFSLFGSDSSRGGIETTTLTESYNPLEDINTLISDEESREITELANLDLGSGDFDEELFTATVVIVAIPVTIRGGVDGELSLKGELNAQGIGLNATLESKFELSAFVIAELDAFIASAGIEADLEIINKTVSFSAGGQFTASSPTLPLVPKMRFEIGSDLDINLKLLKGEVIAFVEYPRVCFCRAFGEIVRKEKSLFSSDYLFNDNINIFSGQVQATVIDI